MDRKRRYTAGIITALVLTLAGASLAGYIIAFDDPFSETEEVSTDVGEKDPSGSGSGEAGSQSEEVPSWISVLLGSTMATATLFLILSGMVYMRSRRGENMVRMDLLDLITINPGINLTSIRRELQLSQGAVSYHIMKLEKSGKIISEKGSKERRYYPSSMGYSNAMKMARQDEVNSILSNDTSRNIVELLRDGNKTQNELVQALEISPSTVHWHMERMKKAQMIRKEQRGRSVYYELLDLPETNT